VVLERMKNSLDPQCDASSSGGYRSVCINIRVTSEEAVRLGCDTHVCEVQLILRSVFTVKSDSGHQRYVKFRNMRAE